MASMRDSARQSQSDKLGRMGLRLGGGPAPSDGNRGQKVKTADLGYPTGKGFHLMQADDTLGTVPNGYADKFKTEAEVSRYGSNNVRQPRARGGAVKKGTTVNVIVATPPAGGPQPGAGGPAPGPSMPPPPPPGPPPGAPPMMAGPGGPMPRKNGGRVSLPKNGGGAGGGMGRLEKVKMYGDRANDGPKGHTGKR